MGIPAVPRYVSRNLKETPPGHRFELYFPLWTSNNWIREEPDKNNLKAGKQQAAESVKPLGDMVKTMLHALRNRQNAIAASLNEMVYRLPAISTAPFITGAGIEHPLENGFAFLKPYGLPYLPGASVKGVLRRATENLASGGYSDSHGWNPSVINELFGLEAESGNNESLRNRGALLFWDVFPEPDGNQLRVDIMTPHYSNYYQGRSTPADCDQPNPILFLTMPPKSKFNFYVQYSPTTATTDLHGKWQNLIQAAFEHTFEWLGFGAKTAVGYGQMQHDTNELQRQQQEAKQRMEERAKADVLAKMTPMEHSIQEILNRRTNPNEPESTTLFQALIGDHWQGDDAVEAAEYIKERMQREKKWKPQSKKPEKDKDYQRTQKVLSYLEDKKP